MSVLFMIEVWLEVDMVSVTGAESSRAVDPKVAAVGDVLSEVETISLGSIGSSSEKKRLGDEAMAISLDGAACCDEEGWLCSKEKSKDLMILAGGELGVDISISDLN
jgi:hypothetical protein